MLDIDKIMHEHRGWTQDVQQEGYTAGLAGEPKDANPYGQSKPGHNHWLYGLMLGLAQRRINARG